MARHEQKAAEPIELTELNTERRTAVIAHSVYDHLDKKADIARRGMFTRSWKANKDIDFLIDHDKTQKPGRVIDLFDDEKKAYTKVKFSGSTLGNDTMLMMDEGIIKGASFGFYTIKANDITIKGKKARELKEVLQDETTVTYALDPINDLAGVVRVTKAMAGYDIKAMTEDEMGMMKKMDSMDQKCLEMMVEMSASLDPKSDLYGWILYQISRRTDMMSSVRGQIQYNSPERKALGDHLQKLEQFCRNTTASDDCIQAILGQIEETKGLISAHDTAFTRKASDPDASVSKELSNALQLLSLKI